MCDRGPRLGRSELHILGCYLFGRRWRAPLARALRIHYSLVRRWAAGERPVSRRATALILELVRRRRIARAAALAARLAAAEARFRAMVEELPAAVRERL